VPETGHRQALAAAESVASQRAISRSRPRRDRLLASHALARRRTYLRVSHMVGAYRIARHASIVDASTLRSSGATDSVPTMPAGICPTPGGAACAIPGSAAATRSSRAPARRWQAAFRTSLRTQCAAPHGQFSWRRTPVCDWRPRTAKWSASARSNSRNLRSQDLKSMLDRMEQLPSPAIGTPRGNCRISCRR